ncbi:amidohydrolase family protein [Desulfosediminicola ganghwensis]|uniref:amidohydrolase family protein n=1 Tax=Desulfosediminicola ganghwensis TaxID=2569540 RepID=UPI0010AC55F7|nr:amidohydrolase family protein [Desulfosediminicola ganghwensis]
MRLSRPWLLILSMLFFILAGHCAGIVDDTACEPLGNERTIIMNVNVIPMDREIVLASMDVVICGDRIVSLSQAGKTTIHEGARVIDGTGLWLMPGFADMHIHLGPAWFSSDWPVNPLKLYLAHGVTTVRCLGPELDENGSVDYILSWRRKIHQGQLAGPTIYSCGPILFGPVTNPEAAVNRQVEVGYDLVKLYSYLTPGEFERAVAAARNQGIYTAGHVPMMVGLDNALQAGMNEIAHIEELAWEFGQIDRSRRDLKGGEWIRYAGRMLYAFFRNDLNFSMEQIINKYQEPLLTIAGKVKAADVSVSSTLFLDQIIIDKLADPEGFLNRQEVRLLPLSYQQRVAQGKDKHQLMFKDFEEFAKFKRNLDLALLWGLRKKGARIVAGTDSGTGGMGVIPGLSLHQELRIVVDAGHSPYEAIAMSTVVASQVTASMTGKDDFGIITPGKRADLLLLGANPLEDIGAIQDIHGVMAAGRWYDKEMLSNWRMQ